MNAKTFMDETYGNIAKALGTENPQVGHSEPIADPLAWQRELEAAYPAPINMRGAHRFWLTVSTLLAREVRVNGSPEFDELIIQLSDTVGLRLTIFAYALDDDDGNAVDEAGGWFKYEFVPWTGEGYSP